MLQKPFRNCERYIGQALLFSLNSELRTKNYESALEIARPIGRQGKLAAEHTNVFGASAA